MIVLPPCFVRQGRVKEVVFTEENDCFRLKDHRPGLVANRSWSPPMIAIAMGKETFITDKFVRSERGRGLSG
jgi:hypothetical protein